MKNLALYAITMPFIWACNGTSSNVESPASAPPFALTMADGTHLSGSAARVDLRYQPGATNPDIEVFFTTKGGEAISYSVRATVGPEFLRTRSLNVTLVTGPLAVGHASVQMEAGEQPANVAQAGQLTLSVSKGKMTGTVAAKDTNMGARFDGPFVLTCSVPATTDDPSAAPSPTAEGNAAAVPLKIDERFESKECAPYRSFASVD